VAALSENPRRFPVLYSGRRRAGVQRFPCGLIFEVEDQRIVVLACIHGRRNPAIGKLASGNDYRTLRIAEREGLSCRASRKPGIITGSFA
jgi:hypothetical protein